MPDRHHEKIDWRFEPKSQEDEAFWTIFLVVILDLGLWAVIGYVAWQGWRWFHV